MNDMFGPGSNAPARIHTDYEELRKKVEACKALGKRVVLTSGTFDILHVGHATYFEKAKEAAGNPENTVLVVGVDSDEKVAKRKGEVRRRTVVQQDERMAMLCHLRHIDLVMLKGAGDPHWQLVRTVRPDILVISERTRYTKEDVEALKEFCGTVTELPSQGETSTTARIRLLYILAGQKFKDGFLAFAGQVRQQLDDFAESIEKMMGGSA